MAAKPFAILAFDLADKRCALPLASAREILRAVAISAVPSAPPLVEGVINVRGALVAVFDLRARLDFEPKPVALTDHLVLLTVSSRTIALRVDRATEVLELDSGEVEIAEQVVPGAGYVAAIAPLPRGILLIYDLERFLSDREFAALEDSVAQRRLPLEDH